MAGPGKTGPAPEIQPDKRTLQLVEALAQQGNDHTAIAAAMRVSRTTWWTARKRHPEFDETFERGQQLRKVSLRKAQWDAAMAGDRTMLVWLGKQDLGQTDKVNATHQGPGGGPIQTMDLSNLTDEQIDALEDAARLIATSHGAPGGDPEGEGEASG